MSSQNAVLTKGSGFSTVKSAHMTDYILAFDLGGTKSAASIISRDGEIVQRVAAPTPTTEGATAIVDRLTELGKDVLSQVNVPIVGIGISAGAPADAAQGLVFDAPNLPGWGSQGFPLAEHLSTTFGNLPTVLENDADATALAEHHFGAGRGCNNMVFMTVGTGIGGGLILDGRLHRGAKGAGGEVGHICVVPNGRPCKCGLSGCLEAYASGPSLTRIARERGYQGEATGQSVISAARAGDLIALSVVDDAAEMLGRGIATLCMLLNPERVVLGTIAVHGADVLLARVDAAVRTRVWHRNYEGLSIVPALLGDRAQDLAALCAFTHRNPVKGG